MKADNFNGGDKNLHCMGIDLSFTFTLSVSVLLPLQIPTRQGMQLFPSRHMRPLLQEEIGYPHISITSP